MTKIVTINTDASFSHEHHLGGFAIWMVYRGERTVLSGKLINVKSALDAEIQAIANGLHVLIKKGYDDIEKVIVNTDCVSAINEINEQNTKRTPHKSAVVVRGLMKKIREMYPYSKVVQAQRKKFIEFRHVKAHTKGETARLWVNNWVDKEARREMRELVREKSEKKNPAP